MKTKKLVTILSIMFVALFAGCDKDDFDETFGVCPLVVSTDPANGDINVPLNKVITVTFNETMNPATLIQGGITLEGTSEVSGTVTYDQSNFTASFTPSEEMESNTTYTGRVKTSVKDLDGNALQEEYVWTFSTGQTISPVVIKTDPENNETGVVVNKIITAEFNMPMNPETINSTTFVLNQGTNVITGVVTYTGTTASFTPEANLTSNTTYTVTITTGAENTEGVPLQSNFVWKFTTGALVAPTVISTNPERDETDVALNKVIEATFSMPMEPSTINGTTFTLKQGTNTISGVVSYTGVTARFTPEANLNSNTVYTATVTTGAENPAGIPLAGNYVWEFTTGASVAPTVISTDPENNEKDVELNKTLEATFSEPMNQATINESSFTLKQGTNTITGVVTYSGTTAFFNPNSDLSENTLYTATITTTATNIAGIPLTNDYIWSFTTGTSTVVVLPDTGTIENFGGFGGSAGLTNQGLNTVINGAIGTTAASTLVTGFHDGLTGDIYTETPLNVGLVTDGIFTAPPAPGTATSFAIAEQALLDAEALYIAISPAAMPGGSDPGAGELGGLVLAPGVYQSASGTFNISNGDLTLDAQGDPNALWVFQTAAGLTVGIAGPTGAKSVNLINGANAANVFWQVGSAATINAAGGGTMVGTIVAMQGVSLSTAGNAVQTVLDGRAISLVASVTMVNTTINVPN
ncbi:MAG: Ig-like domain-containing protein [Flavobacteriaceae bacterium]